MKKLKLSYLLIYFLVLVVVCLLYFNYAYLPMNQKTNNLSTQHAANIGQIATYDANVRGLASIKAQTDKLKVELAGKDKIVPITGAKLEADVEAGLAKAGVTLKQCQFGAETVNVGKVISSDGQPLCSLPITLGFKATYEQLTVLLHYFEKDSAGAYYVNAIGCTDDIANPKILNVNITMANYYFGSHPVLLKDSGK